MTLRHPYTPWLGLVRSLLALATLLSLACNDTRVLFASRYLSSDRVQPWPLSWSLFVLVPSSELVWAQAFACLALLAVMAGYLPRYTAMLHFWISFSYAVTGSPVEGGDQINAILCLLLLPVCLLDPRTNHFSQLTQPPSPVRLDVAASALTVIRVQAAAIYFHAAVGKLAVNEWRDGTAVYYFFTDPVFGMFDGLKSLLMPVLMNSVGVVALTWGTLLLELLLFAGLFIEVRHRKKLLAAGLLFHAGIVVVHGLASFFVSMAALLVLYLGDVCASEPLGARLGWVRGWLARVGGPRAARSVLSR